MTDACGGTATRIVRSRAPDVVIPDMSVTDYVFRDAPVDADGVAIVDVVDGAVWTKGDQLDRTVERRRGTFRSCRPRS